MVCGTGERGRFWLVDSAWQRRDQATVPGSTALSGPQAMGPAAVAVLLLVCSFGSADASGCSGYCGSSTERHHTELDGSRIECYCEGGCVTWKDCCPDYYSLCASNTTTAAPQSPTRAPTAPGGAPSTISTTSTTPSTITVTSTTTSATHTLVPTGTPVAAPTAPEVACNSGLKMGAVQFSGANVALLAEWQRELFSDTVATEALKLLHAADRAVVVVCRWLALETVEVHLFGDGNDEQLVAASLELESAVETGSFQFRFLGQLYAATAWVPHLQASIPPSTTSVIETSTVATVQASTTARSSAHTDTMFTPFASESSMDPRSTTVPTTKTGMTLMRTDWGSRSDPVTLPQTSDAGTATDAPTKAPTTGRDARTTTPGPRLLILAEDPAGNSTNRTGSQSGKGRNAATVVAVIVPLVVLALLGGLAALLWKRQLRRRAAPSGGTAPKPSQHSHMLAIASSISGHRSGGPSDDEDKTELPATAISAAEEPEEDPGYTPDEGTAAGEQPGEALAWLDNSALADVEPGTRDSYNLALSQSDATPEGAEPLDSSPAAQAEGHAGVSYGATEKPTATAEDANEPVTFATFVSTHDAPGGTAEMAVAVGDIPGADAAGVDSTDQDVAGPTTRTAARSRDSHLAEFAAELRGLPLNEASDGGSGSDSLPAHEQEMAAEQGGGYLAVDPENDSDDWVLGGEARSRDSHLAAFAAQLGAVNVLEAEVDDGLPAHDQEPDDEEAGGYLAVNPDSDGSDAVAPVADQLIDRRITKRRESKSNRAKKKKKKKDKGSAEARPKPRSRNSHMLALASEMGPGLMASRDAHNDDDDDDELAGGYIGVMPDSDEEGELADTREASSTVVIDFDEGAADAIPAAVEAPEAKSRRGKRASKRVKLRKGKAGAGVVLAKPKLRSRNSHLLAMTKELEALAHEVNVDSDDGVDETQFSLQVNSPSSLGWENAEPVSKPMRRQSESFSGFAELEFVEGNTSVTGSGEDEFDGFECMGDHHKLAWYVGELDAEACRKLLVASGPGDFLVRTDGDMHILLLNDHGTVQTLQIHATGPGDRCTMRGTTYDTLGHALNHLQRSSLLSRSGLPLHLASPAVSSA